MIEVIDAKDVEKKTIYLYQDNDVIVHTDSFEMALVYATNKAIQDYYLDIECGCY
jgi:hypothetical protein